MAIIDEYDLSPIQKGMLFHHLSGNVPGVDIEQVVVGYNEPLDVALLEQAWRLALERHPVLRTSFEWMRRSDPVQQVHNRVDLHIEVRAVGEDEQGFQEFLARDRACGFDLAQAPLMRLTLFDYGQHRYRLVWTVHHILLDGRAFILVLKDVDEFYQRLCCGEEVMAEPGSAFHLYVEWLKGLDLEGADEFWADRLRGLAGPTPLLEDAQSPGGAFIGYGEEELRLSEETTLALRKVAIRYDITLNTIVMGVWGVLLSRYSGEQDVLFGATKTSRRGSISGADAVAGLFLNTVPVRATLPPEVSIGAVLQELRVEWLSLRAYEHTPLTRIKEASGFASSAALFDSLVVFENQSFLTALKATSQCWKTREWHLLEQNNFPLTFAVYGDPEMLLKLEFDRRNFTHETAQRMLRHARKLFEGIAANPEQKIAELTLLTPGERQQLLVTWNDTKREYRQLSVHQLFEEQVERVPDAIAVVYSEQQLSYRELNERANQLAHHLLRLGIEPQEKVGIAIERLPELIAGLLAILKAGAAYVPIDPAYPLERRDFMLRDCGIRFLLTRSCGEPMLSECAVEFIDVSFDSGGDGDRENPPGRAGLDSPAYVMYTSGSTGRPKGVEILHRGIVRLVMGSEFAEMNEEQIFLHLAPISFDASTFEIWGALLHGAQLVLFPGSLLNAYELGDAISKHGVTTLWLTTSLFNAIVDEAPDRLIQLRQLLVGGEALSVPHVIRAFQALPKTSLINGYGPTENTTFTCCYLIPRDLAPTCTSIPIGRPIANTRVYNLDRNLQPVPIGVVGELHTGGDGLASGYVHLSELTRERFIPDPFLAGERLYKTGDLVRYRADGNLEFLGRADHQVKIRGYRIELGEIETALKEQPEIMQAVVLAREDTPGNKRLVAYLVGAKSDVPSPSELRIRLKQHLPDYMVPTAYVYLDQLPISPNGKIDRKSLPLPTETPAAPVDTYIAPRSDLEKRLSEIWAEVLAVERVGISDDFFEMGGDSLLAVRLIGKIHAAFPECQPSLAVLLKAPTVEQFARTLQTGQAGWSCVVPMREGNERPPFFCVHGGGGNVLSMRDLVVHLPHDQPFYGLQAVGLDGKSAPFSSVEEAAEYYVEQIRKVQPRGPYYLGGNCYGGLVALEMARRLRSIRETVGVVAMIDTYNFAYGSFISKPKLFYCNLLFFLRRSLYHLRKLGRIKPRDWGSYLMSRARTFLLMTRSVAQIAQKEGGNQFPPNFQHADAQAIDGRGELGGALIRVRDAILVATRKYVPKIYDGHLLVFAAKTRDDDPYRDRALGWLPVARGGVTAYEIEGDHVSIFRNPNVGAVAEKLDRALREAQWAAQEGIRSQEPILKSQERSEPELG